MSPLVELSRDQVLQRIAPELIRPLETVKREAVESALILCEGNVAEAAQRLGVSRAHIYKLQKQWRREDA